jgi:hypothetical protein
MIALALLFLAGWGLVLAARQLGLGEVPAVSLTDLSEAELRNDVGLSRIPIAQD